MFSLGVVLLELVEIFRTDMERVRNISELRKGKLPAHLTAHQPQMAQIISQLVLKDPSLRPSARELLEKLDKESMVINELRNQLAEKENEISRLRELLEAAGIKY